jgi:hypothetical protein
VYHSFGVGLRRSEPRLCSLSVMAAAVDPRSLAEPIVMVRQHSPMAGIGSLASGRLLWSELANIDLTGTTAVTCDDDEQLRSS